MKFCGYCGASLEDSAALSFCPECGEKLVSAGQKERRESDETPSLQRKSKVVKKKPKPVKAAPAPMKEEPFVDDGYDGYYNDVSTDDDGRQQSEGMDPKLLKQVLLIALGAIVVIGLATLMIFFL